MNATQSAERAGLIADVVEHPADDAPRLIYADWLDDEGQGQRARFIRLQVELVSGPQCMASIGGTPHAGCHWCITQKESRNLLHANYPKNGWLWAGEPLNVIPDAQYTFRRGFVAEVRCTLDDWQQHGPAVVRAHPVTRVKLSDKRPDENASPPYTPVYWYNEESVDPDAITLPCRLPDAIFSRLGGEGDGPSARWFPSIAAANDALSAACLAWARLPDEQRRRLSRTA